MSDLAVKRQQLLDYIAAFDSCAVAFSAGVDSTVVAQAAFDVLADRAVAVTATSPSLAAGELDQARELAEQIGIRHEVIETREFEQPEYRRNSPDRCYHCKDELYEQLGRLAPQLNVEVLLNGANLDDLGDYRPGMRAASEHEVKSPLADCGLTKSEVRQLAADWGLPIWDKPASPCLASRVAYGLEVTPERLARIDRAEQFLRAQGLSPLRVREHAGDLARIEVSVEVLAELTQSPLAEEVNLYFQQLGYKFVTLDLSGFRSGSLNQLLTLDPPAEAT